jgi:extradiol dioxygenase family protein
VNLDFYGTQITLQPGATFAPPPDFHFGVNLGVEEFDRLARTIDTEVRVVDAGTPMERKKLYLRCPSGYVIEVKGYR